MHSSQASGARLLASISHTQQLCLHDLAQLDDPDSEPEAAAEEATPAQVCSRAEPGAMLASDLKICLYIFVPRFAKWTCCWACTLQARWIAVASKCGGRSAWHVWTILTQKTRGSCREAMPAQDSAGLAVYGTWGLVADMLVSRFMRLGFGVWGLGRLGSWQGPGLFFYFFCLFCFLVTLGLLCLAHCPAGWSLRCLSLSWCRSWSHGGVVQARSTQQVALQAEPACPGAKTSRDRCQDGLYGVRSLLLWMSPRFVHEEALALGVCV